MKVFKIDIDVAKPTVKVLGVPCTGETYGIQVKPTAEDKRIASPFCRLLVDNMPVEASVSNADGSFLFEIGGTADLPSKNVVLHVGNSDATQITEWDGLQTIFVPKYGDEEKTDLSSVVVGGVIWYAKKDTNPPEYFTDDEQITFTDTVEYGYTYHYKEKGRTKTGWKVQATIPAGKYYPRELDRAFRGGSIGLPCDCKVRVICKENGAATPDVVIEPDAPEAVVIDGVKYVPTTVTIGDVEYTILAAEQDEVDSTDSTLTDGLIG